MWIRNEDAVGAHRAPPPTPLKPGVEVIRLHYVDDESPRTTDDPMFITDVAIDEVAELPKSTLINLPASVTLEIVLNMISSEVVPAFEPYL